MAKYRDITNLLVDIRCLKNSFTTPVADYVDGYLSALSSVEEMVNAIPAEDVIKVVRCINCYFANEDGTICRHGVGKDTEPDNFCKYGVTRCDGRD